MLLLVYFQMSSQASFLLEGKVACWTDVRPNVEMDGRYMSRYMVFLSKHFTAQVAHERLLSRAPVDFMRGTELKHRVRTG